MKKRIGCLVFAFLLMISAVGCAKEKDNDETVSYVTSYIEEEVDDGSDANEAKDEKSGKEDKKDASSGETTKAVQKEKSTNHETADINVKKSGTVDSLNFGGKKFTKTIIGTITQATMRRKAAFEKKFNCKIELVSLQWESYNSQVATAVAAGNPYDICGLQSYFWPEAGVQGLYEPLNDYISKDDLYNSKTGIGIDLNTSGEFMYKNKLYGVSNHSGAYASMVQVMFYNKAMFKAAGLKDPLELYNSGQWTWDKFFEYGKKVYNKQKNKYLCGRELSPTSFALSNGFEYVKYNNGKVTENLSDKKYHTALKKYGEFMKNYAGPKGYSDDPSEFYNGNHYMFSQMYSYGQYYMYDSIVASSAFKNDYSNLGIVPWPIGPDNTNKVTPGHGGQAKSAGKGSKDPRIVIAWTKFEREFKDPQASGDKTMYSPEIQKLITSLFDRVNDTIPNYKTSSNSARTLISKIEKAAATGGDYVSLINSSKGTIQSIINDSLKQ